MKEYSRKRKEKVIEILGGKCANCGCAEISKLEVDHKNRNEKSLTFGKRWHQSWTRILEEIKKCQLLCKKCHIEKTVKERKQKLARGTHGTLSSYRYCKCEVCRKANRDYFREYNKRDSSSIG